MLCNEMSNTKGDPKPMPTKPPRIEDFGNGIFIIWKI